VARDLPIERHRGPDFVEEEGRSDGYPTLTGGETAVLARPRPLLEASSARRRSSYTGLRRSTSEAGAVPNIPDEPADDIAAKLAREIPPDVVRAIMRDVVDWIRLTFVADRQFETDERAAIKTAACIDLRLVTGVASHLQGHPGFPRKTPGAALRRLVAALTAHSDGEHDEVLSPRSDGDATRGRHPLPLYTRLERVESAVAMELLMARRPQSAEDAAKELLDLLRDSLAAALVRQWRTLKAGGDSIAAESFRDQVDLARREVEERKMTADAYIAVIRTMLIPKN
jgi:hypothetical protein